MRTCPVPLLMLLASCGNLPTAPQPPIPPPAVHTVRYIAGCVGVFRLELDDQPLGLYWFDSAGKVLEDTVTVGEHEVGYWQLDAYGWALKTERRILAVKGPTDYPLTCAS